MTYLKTAAAVATLLLCAAPMAFAGSASDYFTKIDADASGVVTQAEYVAHKTAGGKYTVAEAGEKFTKLAGSDGQLTLAEMETAMKASETRKKDCNKTKDRAA